MSTHALKIREQSGQSLQWLLSGSEALQLFSGYCRCHIASNNILSDKYHRKFSRTNDATQDSEETATAFTVSQTSHNSRKKL